MLNLLIFKKIAFKIMVIWGEYFGGLVATA